MTSDATCIQNCSILLQQDSGYRWLTPSRTRGEANPKADIISFVSAVATFLMGKVIGDVDGTSGQELKIIAIS